MIENHFNDKYKLGYITKNTGDITIVFVPGNSLTLDIFNNQFSDSMFDEYSILAMDLPGHGESPPADNPELTYSVKGLASTLSEFIKETVHGPVVLVGYSLSGNIVIEMAPQLTNTIGIVINGTPPVSSLGDIVNGYLPDTSLAEVFFEDNLDEDKLNKFCRFCTNSNRDYDKVIKEMIIKTDKSFRGWLGKTVMQEQFGDEVKILENLEIPVAVLHGELDSLINLDYLRSLKIPKLWRGEVQIVESAPHLIHLTHTAEFNKLLHNFISQECTN